MVQAERQTVNELVRCQIERDRLYRGNRTALFPKSAKILDIDPEFNVLSLQKGENFTLSGDGVLGDTHMIGRRTVFLEQPVSFDGVDYYLEIKGYGLNGRELFTNKHDEGDLFFGLFLDFAEREYYFPKILEENGVLTIQRPVALLEFSLDDFVSFVMPSLAHLIDIRSKYSLHTDRIREAVKRVGPGRKIAKVFIDTYKNDGIEKALE